MRTGIANLPLHDGKAPVWLFNMMTRLAREIAIIIVDEFGAVELMRKISDPFWLQAFGALMGFDWHSSGVTTTVCGALKEGLKGREAELGIFIAGGKGKAGIRTPQEILDRSKFIKGAPDSLIYASRMAAKVDSAGVQDGYQIYHHTFFFTPNQEWAVVQQGMNPVTGYARRYHWLTITPMDSFVDGPHTAISATRVEKLVLNTVAKGYNDNRSASTELACQHPDKTITEFKKVQTLNLPARHRILLQDIKPDHLYRTLTKIYEEQPDEFETLMSLKGVGAKTIRALTLTSEIIYGKPTSFVDPARFAYAHGGKDGHPYPVERENYEHTIAVLEQAIYRAKIGDHEKLSVLKRLSKINGKKSL